MLGSEYTIYIMSHALKVAFENTTKIWMYQPMKEAAYHPNCQVM